MSIRISPSLLFRSGKPRLVVRGRYGFYCVGKRYLKYRRDKLGRICTTCHWYKPSRDFHSYGCCTCFDCLCLQGLDTVNPVIRPDSRRAPCFGGHTELDWYLIRKRYDHRCLGCGQRDPDVVICADHIVPLLAGGKDTPDNLQPLCKSCNTIKSVRIIDFRSTYPASACPISAGALPVAITRHSTTITPAMRRALAAAGRIGGAVSTPRKAAAAAANARHSAAVRARSGPALRSLHQLACPASCGVGMALVGHRATCPRGRAIKRRGLLPPS